MEDLMAEVLRRSIPSPEICNWYKEVFRVNGLLYSRICDEEYKAKREKLN